MKRLLIALSVVVALAQATGVTVGLSMTGTGQTITGNIVIPLGPSTFSSTCLPAILGASGSVVCTIVLDQPIPPGMTGNVTIGPITGCPTCTAAPLSLQIPSGGTKGTVTISRP
jgi:hypothetical protein